MPPRRNIKTKERVIAETPVLDSLELEKGTLVRFRIKDDVNWSQGKILGDNKDGSLTILEYKAGIRSIMPENVQRKDRGPRGGDLWVDVV
jgi:hypothetical protein